jgi:hypothetical protein
MSYIRTKQTSDLPATLIVNYDNVLENMNIIKMIYVIQNAKEQEKIRDIVCITLGTSFNLHSLKKFHIFYLSSNLFNGI